MEIPIEARIVACCDAYDAMTTDRAYRAALPTDVALCEISDGAGHQFDPEVAAALVRVLERRPDVSAEAAEDLPSHSALIS